MCRNFKEVRGKRYGGKKIVCLALITYLLPLIYGCETSGVQVRTYIEDRKRVDQELRGNAGYLTGMAKKAPGTTKATRKVYVVEVATKDKVPPGLTQEEKKYQKDIPQDLLKEHRKRVKKTPLPYEPEIQLPSFDDIEDVQIEKKQEKAFIPSSIVAYTVEKDDTLQKISKKFYGSYSKWPRIYENNKELITSPDHIKPGITIQVPIE